MRVLFVYYNDGFSTKEFGGLQVSKRNKYFLEKVFGVNNVIDFPISGYKNKALQLFFSIFGFSNGVKFSIISDFKKIIRKVEFDYLFLDSSKFGVLLNYSNFIPNRIVFFHNIEINFIKLSINNNPFKKVFSKSIVYAVRKNEKNSIIQATSIITLNRRDSDQIALNYYINRVADMLLPITFKDNFNFSEMNKVKQDIDMLFIGSDFYGNTEGLFWFIRECLPYIDGSLFVIGNGMEKYQDQSTKKVKFIGYVKDIDAFYYRAKLIVLPIISGSGMKTKTCEALMYGKYIFGSQEAFEGYEITEFSEVGGLCETRDDYIIQINDFLIKRKNYYSENNRLIFNKKYNTINILDGFKNYIHQLSKEGFLQNEK